MKEKTLLIFPILLLTACLSGCGFFSGGGNYTTTTGGNGNQNFIFDPSGELINGKVTLVVIDKEKADEQFEEYCKNKTLSADEIIAYKYDMQIATSTKLCEIVYDTEKTGSYTYSFDMKKTIGNCFDYNVTGGVGTIDSTKYEIALCFHPEGSGMRNIKYTDYSTFRIKIEYTYNTGDGIRNISREKSGTKDMFSNIDVRDADVFKNNVTAGSIYYQILEAGENLGNINSDTKLTFSGYMTAKIY